MSGNRISAVTLSRPRAEAAEDPGPKGIASPAQGDSISAGRMTTGPLYRDFRGPDGDLRGPDGEGESPHFRGSERKRFRGSERRRGGSRESAGGGPAPAPRGAPRPDRPRPVDGSDDEGESRECVPDRPCPDRSGPFRRTCELGSHGVLLNSEGLHGVQKRGGCEMPHPPLFPAYTGFRSLFTQGPEACLHRVQKPVYTGFRSLFTRGPGACLHGVQKPVYTGSRSLRVIRSGSRSLRVIRFSVQRIRFSAAGSPRSRLCAAESILCHSPPRRDRIDGGGGALLDP